MKKKIYVTRPSLPSLDEFIPYLEKIWESQYLTNNGQFHRCLEQELCKYLGVKQISLFCNGTIALLAAIQSLHITGEVITTPFSFVATAHALKWNGITPVFADIDRNTFNIYPESIERVITDKTSAIMPVHVYGTPCDVDGMEKLAGMYGLKIIYDAAHAFGVRKDGVSILNYGDLSVLSFHATKTFTTFEGGAIVCHDEKTKDRIDKLKNFGFAGETEVIECGINGKMNEVQAAFGLVYLKHIDSYIGKRKNAASRYRELLKDIDGIRILNDIDGIQYNYSYFPILIDEDVYGRSRDQIYEKLKENNIYCRRYFYPLITDFPMYQEERWNKSEALKTAKMIGKQILCLPLYPEIENDCVTLICTYIRNSCKKI